MGLIVPPSGSIGAKICILGGRPGRSEVEDGQPFTGESGRLLWRLLGIARQEVYVTNIRKDFSYKNPMPTKDEIREVLPELKAELDQCQANIFVALGVEPLQVLSAFEHKTISKWRGSVLESPFLPGRKFISTYHPASCLYTDHKSYSSYHNRYLIEYDLRRAKHESFYRDIRRSPREFIINPPIDEAISRLRKLGPRIAVDIETFGDRISCVGAADSPTSALCIGFIGGPYTVSELVTIWRELDNLLRTREIIGQNIQFDTTRLERLGFQLPNIYHDTMLAHHLLWTELGMQVKRRQGDRGVDSLSGKHSLAFISSIYTDEPYYKDESDQAWQTPDLPTEERYRRYWTYNCKDCCVTYEAYEKMEKELHRYNQHDYYHNRVIPLIRPIMRMQDRGLLVDLGRLTSVRRRIELELAVMQLQFNQQIGFQCNVKSPQDITYLIQNVLHLPQAKLTKTGKPKTDEETLQNYAFTSAHAELFKQIIDIRERRTLLSSFLNLELENGRYKANYLIHGTDSGRLSSRSARKGPQLQNIPKSTRNIFITSPNKVFAQGDLARAEATYVAYDARCDDLIAAYSDIQRDLYSELATQALGIPVSKQRNAWARELFKRVIHGSNYKMGPLRFVAVLRLAGIDIGLLPVPGRSNKAKAEYVQGYYLNRYPEIGAWQQRIEDEVRQTRCLFDAFGRRRMFLGRMDDALFRAACSYPPQATIVSITNQAIEKLDAQGYELVLQVHDSLTIEVEDTRLHQCMEDIRKAMSIPITLHGRTFTIPVDLTYGKSWGYLKDYTPTSNDWFDRLTSVVEDDDVKSDNKQHTD